MAYEKIEEDEGFIAQLPNILSHKRKKKIKIFFFKGNRWGLIMEA